MKILVTGSAGFIGFHLSKRLLEMGIEVIGIDNFNKYYDSKLKFDRYKVLEKISKNLVWNFSVNLKWVKTFSLFINFIIFIVP